MQGELTPRYKRILLKLSGEALAGDGKSGINPDIINQIASEVKEVAEIGVEVAMVIGAGNIFRGAMAEALGISRSTGDFMGMLATVMNSMAVENTLEKMNMPTRVLTAIEMKHVAEPYTIQKAEDHLKKGRIVIAAGGTGHPYFTTDTAASLRAVELGCDILLKATRVDGVYTSDPEKDPTAEKIEEISFIEVIKRQLRVMDLTAISLCMDNNLPIIVFNLFEKGSLKRIVFGEKIGTKIS
ncbi:MAG TPA: UMP kinase [Spirochaetota bacterium]|nr:UMP kinase [Spirochaetota bacterium]